MTAQVGQRAPLDSDEHWQSWPSELAQRYRERGYWTGELLGDIGRAHAADRGGSLAVVDPRHRWTFADLERSVDALSRGWLDLGLRRGDRVVLHLPNSAEFVSVLLSLFRSGLVPVMALPAHREHEIGYFVEHAEARAYVSSDRVATFDQLALGTSLRDRWPDLRHVVAPGAGRAAGAADAPVPPGAVTLTDVEASGRESTTVVEAPRAHDLALLQLSGGTTGTPKLIPRTHDDYLYSVRASTRICGVDADSVFLCVLPASHNFALSSAGSLGALLAGATTVMAPDPSAATAFALIESEEVTVTGVVPPVALLWLAARQRSPRDLRSLRSLLVGGAKLSSEVARRIEPELGCRLQQVFGMAEGLVNYTRFDDPEHLVLQTQGRPISEDDEVFVVDDDDRPVGGCEPGHLLTRGPYTIRSYYRAHDHDAVAFTEDGCYRTGDLVVQHPSGHLTVVGRSKDQVNRGGEKIAPEEVENHLLTHPAVHEVSVVGEPDPVLGERVAAYVVLRDGDACPPDDPLRGCPNAAATALRRHLGTRGLATFKVPDRFTVVAELPRTGVGKTHTGSLRARAEEC